MKYVQRAKVREDKDGRTDRACVIMLRSISLEEVFNGKLKSARRRPTFSAQVAVPIHLIVWSIVGKFGHLSPCDPDTG